MKKLKTLAAALALAAAVPAHAEDLLVTPIYTDDGLSYNVTVDGTPLVPARSPEAFNVFNETTNSSFIAFCIELTQDLSPFADFGIADNYDALTLGDGVALQTGAADAPAKIQALFDTYYGSITDFTQNEAVAFQLALWELTDDSNLSTGRFVWTDAAGGTPTDATFVTAQNMLDTLVVPAGGTSSYELIIWNNPEYQDLIQVAGRNTVPEPATLALLGLAGVAGFGVMRRKKA